MFFCIFVFYQHCRFTFSKIQWLTSQHASFQLIRKRIRGMNLPAWQPRLEVTLCTLQGLCTVTMGHLLQELVFAILFHAANSESRGF